jgi:hypothetical protein
MKQLLILSLVVLTACASRKSGCGIESYRHRFQVEHIQKQGPMYVVTVRNYFSGKKYVGYDNLPDSVKVGAYVQL